MNASSPSSARSPLRWAATLGPSRRRRLLVALLALGAVRALALCDLPVALFAALALLVCALAVHDVRGAAGGGNLALDREGRWHVDGFGRDAFTGRLLPSGYRGGQLIVLVIERDGRAGRLGRERRHVAVPVDAIDADGFSFLHLQLACAGESR